VTACYNAYLEWFEVSGFTEKQKKRNMACAQMHWEVGNKQVAQAVLEIGMPKDLCSRFSHKLEQTIAKINACGLVTMYPHDQTIPTTLLQSMLTDAGAETLKEHVRDTIVWIRHVAKAAITRRQRDEYKEIRNRDGKHHQSGLDPDEQHQRQQVQKCWRDVRYEQDPDNARYIRHQLNHLNAQPKRDRTKPMRPYRVPS
jgi:hypothetical protein